MYQRLGPDFPLIGVGGVNDTEAAMAKIEAGATLVQLYTGLIYEGPGLPGTILRGLSARFDAENIANIADVRGRQSAQWAVRELSTA